MKRVIISMAQHFKGKPRIPGDKSISHRGLIFGAMAAGRSEVIDILESADVQSTAQCLRELGVEITQEKNKTFIKSPGKGSFKNPTKTLDCGNSGTTLRLLMGLLSAEKMTSRLTGDGSLIKRPMRRVADPLELMGASFELTQNNFAPLTVIGSRLKAIDYSLKVASAQIKTAIILAALSAEGETRISGEIHSRDHTERLLAHYGVSIDTRLDEIRIKGDQKFHSASLQVPGDPSTASFWMAAASMIPGAQLELNNISLNPTRTGFLNVLQRSGVEVSTEITSDTAEPVGRILVQPGNLQNFHVSHDEIPSLIDEVPLLAILATQAKGRSIIEGAEELRVKESDRLEAVAKNLKAMGAEIEVRKDGFIIEGGQRLHGAQIETYGDHRIAMAFSIAALLADGETSIDDSECVAVSYPSFFEDLRELTQDA